MNTHTRDLLVQVSMLKYWATLAEQNFFFFFMNKTFKDQAYNLDPMNRGELGPTSVCKY